MKLKKKYLKTVEQDKSGPVSTDSHAYLLTTTGRDEICLTTDNRFTQRTLLTISDVV